jgi:hypothetical protein
MPPPDEVRLAVPASPEFVRLVRVTATGLASRVGFTYDEVEDLRLAIDELCHSVVGAKGRSGRLSVRYGITEDGLAVDGQGEADGGPVPALSDLSRQILGALVDEYGASVDSDGRPSFHLLKKHAPS